MKSDDTQYMNPPYKPSDEVFNFSKVGNLKFEGVDMSDFPDMVDSYVSEATYDGHECSEEEIELINDNRDLVYSKLMNHLF